MINVIDKIRLLFRKDKELYSSLYDILGFYPHNITLYKQALAHSSSSMYNEKGKKINNERLEFLGDAIIEAVTSDIVYHHFEQKREGFLTTTRSKLVQRDTLNKLASELGIDKLVQSNGHNTGHNNYIGGNAFEALVGAIYIDRDYKTCMWFLKRRIIAEHLNLDNVANKEVNFKSKLLEWTQKNRLTITFDNKDNEINTNNATIFNSEIKIEDIVCGNGQGFSKKESQQNASKEAIKNLHKEKFLDLILKSKERRTAIESEIISAPPIINENDGISYASKRHHKHVQSKQVSLGQVSLDDNNRIKKVSNSHNKQKSTIKPPKVDNEIISGAESQAFSAQNKN